MYKDKLAKYQGSDVTPKASLLCRERPTMRAYMWLNDDFEQDEIVCPFSYNRWGTGPIPHVSDYAATTFEGMKDKSLNDLNYRAAGNTLLHESLHSRTIVRFQIREEKATLGLTVSSSELE
ncbi:hypothetical protein EYZ11_010509 [Aspergillus tanneri]|uniref:Uncharacterized protein n=1 Tax=Aspergillus tanneri TaxID=1220188 RepID=A0A4S3J578_9EURO|nr:hypothetical protein EYZ11_010509 [Aspergillus tanneri]